MDLVTFLKKYTKINNNFIDDFFGLYDTKDKYNFSIDIDVIAKWLNIRKLIYIYIYIKFSYLYYILVRVPNTQLKCIDNLYN